MKEPADLVFDLDGTISDPLNGILRCANFALSAHGFEPASEETIATLIGPPLDDAFRALVPDADDSLVRSLVSGYRVRYAEVGYAENALYEGVADALEVLRSRGLTFGVCTSKRADFAEKILELFGLRGHFSFVSGGDIGVRKQQQLSALLSAGQIDGSSRMIGDRAVDMLAAAANGLSGIGVLWGYGSESELRAAGASLLLSDVSDLTLLAHAA